MRSLARVSILASTALWLILVLVVMPCIQMPAWRVSHASERAPNYLVGGAEANLVFMSGLTSVDNHAVASFLIEPTGGDLIVPGTSRPLRPGEAVVSPNIQDRSDFISAQFGEVVGTVSEDILIDDSDAVVYARPANGADFMDRADFDYGAEYADGFGPNRPFRNGSVVYDSWAGLLPWLVAISLMPPVAVMTWVSRHLTRKGYRREIQDFSARRCELSPVVEFECGRVWCSATHCRGNRC